MVEVMIRLLNMTFTAGCTVLLILVLRLLFRKLPKGYSYALWFIVLFRFLCPVAIPSLLSLLPVSPEPVRQEIVYEKTPEIDSGVIWVDRAVNQVLEENLSAAEVASVNPIQIVLYVMSVIWQAGVLVLFLGNMAGFLRLRRRLATAVRVEKGIYESDRIDGAFVVGIFRPAVYLPKGLEEENRRYILKHELIHIRRRDYLVKLLGLCVVMVHWFNPLAWLSFGLLCKDMEMSCDEQVLKELGQGEKKLYSLALLHAAEQKSGLLLPLAFGESHTRSRIKNVLNYRKPGFWITVVAVVAVAAAGVGLMTDPAVKNTIEEAGSEIVSVIGGTDGPTSIFIAGKIGDGEAADFDQMPDMSWLAETTVPAGYPGEEQAGKLILDYASEDMVIFHGDFGLFAFARQGDQWNLAMHVRETDVPNMDEIVESLAGSREWRSQDRIHMEDKLTGSSNPGSSGEESLVGGSWREIAADKTQDGKVVVLGGYISGGSLRLIDLFYGYYHPEEQAFHQVYLFGGDRRMLVNPKGNVSEQRFLFSRDGYDYYLRTPESLLDFESGDGETNGTGYTDVLPYERLELIRCQGGKETVLDNLIIQSSLEQQKIVVAGDRIVYSGAATADMDGLDNPGLISIAMDGSDRRAAGLAHNVYDGLSYEGGYLYYQGWTNDGAFPRPLYRMTPNFEEKEFLADIDGSLMTVKEGGIVYIYNWKEAQVEVCAAGSQGKTWSFDRPGENARYHVVETEQVGNIMTVTLKPVDESGEVERYRMYVPGKI